MTVIMGRPSQTYTELTAATPASASPLFVTGMMPALWSAGLRYGVDPTVMVAQAGHETGWGTFGRAVRAAWRNTCGLKVRDTVAVIALLGEGISSEHPLCHAQFASWRVGAEAHAQHLRAYCQVPVDGLIVDPRYDVVVSLWPGRRPCVEVADLGGLWAPSPDYGRRVQATVDRLLGVNPSV